MSITEPAEATVEVAQGRLEGLRMDGVSAFLGIPYGAPTGGRARFRAPSPPPSWSGTRRAQDYGPACPQPPIRDNLVIDPAVERAMFGLADEPQSEDCLSLNLWTPALDDAARPVLVSFHGGGFKSGSGSARGAPWFDGSRLARGGDVVLVTVNHRIGVLGHLHLAERPDAANVGLLDLVAALEWLRDNVARFGGDPNCVTIFGESGGGGKVMALVAMPRARGLFHRAICQSGTMSWGTPAEGRRVTEAVMRAAGAATVDELERLEVDELISAGLAVARAGMRFGPIVETGSVLPLDAIDALAGPVGAEVPLIIGVTRDEAAAFLGVPQELSWEALEAQVGERAAAYRRAHPDRDPWHTLVDIRTDETFRHASVRAAAARAERGGAPVYMFEFAWETPVLGGVLGAAHGVDVSFPFENTDRHPSTAGSDSAARLAPLVRDAWVAFARDGDPNHPALVPWPPYDAIGGETLIFDEQCRVEQRPAAEQLALAPSG